MTTAPDAPQPATTDDAIERAGGASCGGSYCTADAQIGPHRHADGVIYRTGAGAEPRATLLRLADEMQHAEWPGTGAEARAVVEAIADTLRDEAARSGAGAEVDREALRAVLDAHGIEFDGMGSRAAMDNLLTDILAARGDAATPTVTTEQREQLARAFLAAVVGDANVEHHVTRAARWPEAGPSRFWLEALERADAALAALGVSVR